MAWMLYGACVLGGVVGLALLWRLMRWLGEHGSWPGDPGGSI